MHDDRAALCRGHDVRADHGVAAHPLHAVALLRGLRATEVQRPDVPARIPQLPCHFATDTTRGAQYQCGVAVHLMTPYLCVAMDEV